MNTPQLLKEIGKQISIIRNRSNLSQFVLNRMCGYPEGTVAKENRIAKYEKGEINITLEALAMIAEKCECRVEIKFRKIRGKKIKPAEEEIDADTPGAIIRMRKALVANTGS